MRSNLLDKEIKYTLVVEAVAVDGVISRNIISFKSNVTVSNSNRPPNGYC